jgi:hypothetical protein
VEASRNIVERVAEKDVVESGGERKQKEPDQREEHVWWRDLPL